MSRRYWPPVTPSCPPVGHSRRWPLPAVRTRVSTSAPDVTDPDSAAAAVQATVRRFGRLDVVVDNAATFRADFFEELTPHAFRAQVETSVLRSGQRRQGRASDTAGAAFRSAADLCVLSAGITGGEFLSAYAASKFAPEGFIESVTAEVAPFVIHSMLAGPGFFCTELLTPESTRLPRPRSTTTPTVTTSSQPGSRRCRRVTAFEQPATLLLEEANADGRLSSNLDHGR